VACGAAGGISAIFGAPLAGVMFSVEVILGDFGVQTLTPIIIASVLAAVTHQVFAGWTPRFDVPHHGIIGIREVPLMVLLGLVAAFLSVFFIRALYGIEDRFQAWRAPRALKPAVGMALAGTVALAFPEVLGDGYEATSSAFRGEFPLQVLVGIVLAKLLATALVVGSGNVGGLFAPSLLIGAALGGFFGGTVDILQPGGPGTVTVYALVGMGAMIAATTHAPITGILLVFEMTHDYAIVLPAMLAVATSVIVSSRLQRESIYTLKLVRKGIHLKRGVDTHVMSSMRVREVMRPATELIPEDMTFDRLLAFLEGSNHNTFCVMSGETLTGVISYQDIRTVLSQGRSPELSRLVVAGDVATPDPVTVIPEATLDDAMRLFGLRDLSLLPVVETRDGKKVVGVLHRADVLNAYTRALMERPPR
jgi:CIC family chloride channel protein